MMVVAAVDDTNMIMLRSSEGDVFEVSKEVAMESQTIKNMIEYNCTVTEIPLPNVSTIILSKVIEYCNKHVNARHQLSRANGVDNAVEPVDEATKDVEAELKTFDSMFIHIDHSTLYNIMLAANYLHIQGLLDLTCEPVADMIKGKTPEEVRKIFNIKNDYTLEEDEDTRRENKWAFES
ncbi:hypothetical protein GUJ93_ZPchr0009g1405 [Zizania palustris]|uniref:SKP1-like protein n=1 Tax=Zizania palustris TaxID=103762 RepID=A0A8J5RJP9_ZIZPA|nr:hypothetical protein GUJ93_ZPchr0009g1405 [Zizania palustris]